MFLKTKRILIFTYVFIFTIVSFCLIAYAHPGRTDKYGGHYDNSTGEYHYHHGYPAHQHINGECPYDYDDKTNYSLTEDSGGSNDISNDIKASLLLCGIISFAVLFYIIFSLFRRKKRNKQSEKFRNQLLPLLNEINQEQKNITAYSASILKNECNNIKYEYTDLLFFINELDRKKRKSIILSDYFKSFFDVFPHLGESMMSDFTANELANIPERYYFDGKKLYSKNNVYSFELYKTSTGKIIHLIKGCSGADISINISEFDSNKYVFCKKCFNSKNNSIVYQMLVYGFPTWYKDYMFFYNLKHTKLLKDDKYSYFLKLLNHNFK